MTEYTLLNAETREAVDQELLTVEQEAELSKLILNGEEAKTRLETGCPPFTAGERPELELAVFDGKWAFERLVLANLRLAWKLANEAARKNPGSINEGKDYEQAAYIALCECARTFDWRYGVHFSTYAWPRIRQMMIRENAYNAFAMRLSEDLLYKVTRMHTFLEGHTVEEAAEELGMTVEQIFKLKAATTSGASLEEPVDPDGMECELGEMLADETALTGRDIEERIQLEGDIEWLYACLEELPELEHDLICKRFGLCGETPHKYSQLTGFSAKTVGGVQKQIMAILRRMRESEYDILPLAG